jgi:hypothetical protein
MLGQGLADTPGRPAIGGPFSEMHFPESARLCGVLTPTAGSTIPLAGFVAYYDASARRAQLSLAAPSLHFRLNQQKHNGIARNLTLVDMTSSSRKRPH